MEPKAIRAYLARDWQAVSDEKDRFWLEQRAQKGLTWAFDVAEALRRQVLVQHPGWPSMAEREADRDVHDRVSVTLQRVRSDTSR